MNEDLFFSFFFLTCSFYFFFTFNLNLPPCYKKKRRFNCYPIVSYFHDKQIPISGYTLRSLIIFLHIFDDNCTFKLKQRPFILFCPMKNARVIHKLEQNNGNHLYALLPPPMLYNCSRPLGRGRKKKCLCTPNRNM